MLHWRISGTQPRPDAGRYVGVEATETDDIHFEERFAELKETLVDQFSEADKLNALINRMLKKVQV